MMMRGRKLVLVFMSLFLVQVTLVLQGCGPGGPPPPNLWAVVYNAAYYEVCRVGTYVPGSFTLGLPLTYGAVFQVSPLQQGDVLGQWRLLDVRSAGNPPSAGSGDFGLSWSLLKPPPAPPVPCAKFWEARFAGYEGGGVNGLTKSSTGTFAAAHNVGCGCGNQPPLTEQVLATFTPFGGTLIGPVYGTSNPIPVY